MSDLRPNSRPDAPGPGKHALAIAQLIATGGAYPERGTGQAVSTLAMVHSFAADYGAYGAANCDGRQMPIAQNQAPFSVIGTAYGGDGRTTFALPDLRQRIAVGGGPGQPSAGDSVSMTYLIAVGAGAYPMMGAIGLFAGNYAPAGWLPADGSLLPISQNVGLFEAIGKTFGGDGVSTFALPNLNGRAAVGTGEGPGMAAVALGQAIEDSPSEVPGLGLNYIVNMTGAVPPNQGGGGFPTSAAVMAEVLAYAGASVQAGWAAADGRLLMVADNRALFELIGTTYGGDGQETFALPDLRGQMIAGFSQ